MLGKKKSTLVNRLVAALALASAIVAGSGIGLNAQAPEPETELLYARSLLGNDATAVWEFEGRAGQTVEVTAASDSFDTVIELQSPAGDSLGTNDDDETGTDSRLTTTLPADGRYRVQVRAWLGGAGGAYEVAVRVVAAPPTTVDSPPELLLYARGSLDGVGAGDWSFEGRAGQTVEVTAASNSFDTVVELRDPTGEYMASNDDDGGDTNSRLVASLPVDGRYTVQVRAWGLDGTGGAYEVSVRVAATPHQAGRTGRPHEEEEIETAAWSFENRDVLRYVPREVNGLVFADVRAANDSDLPQWLGANRVALDAWRELQDEVGVDLEAVDYVLAGADDSAGIAVIGGRFDNAWLEALARRHGYVAAVHDNRRLFELEGNAAIAILEPGVIAIGSPPLVRRALARPAAADGVDSNEGLMGLLRHVDPESTVWGVVRLQEPVDEMAALAFGSRFDDGLRGTLTVESTNDISGDQLRTQMRILLAIAGRSAGSALERNLLTALQVTGEGSTATLAFSWSSRLLQELLAAGNTGEWMAAGNLDAWVAAGNLTF